MRSQAQGGHGGAPGVGKESCDEIAKKVGETAMAGMLNLRNVFELVDDGFDNGPFAQEQLVEVGQQFGDQVEIVFGQQVGEPLGDVAFVGKALAPELFKQSRSGVAVIDSAWREATGEQLAFVCGR